MSRRRRGGMRLLLINLLSLLCLAACTPFGSADSQSTPSQKTGTETAVTTQTWMPTQGTSPTPTIGPLPPQCPISPPSAHGVFPSLQAVIGATPIWATWPAGANRFHPNLPSPYPSNYLAPYGWQASKIIWEVGPLYTQPVTVEGSDIYDHTPLYLQFGDNDTPTAVTVLDPRHPDHSVSVLGSDWTEWGVYLVIPKAGCYRMEVSWPSGDSQPAGHWEITFAEGV